MKRKITVTTGTRADYGILRPLLHTISKSKKLELNLIVTGMHLSKKHGMTIKEIQNDGFKITTKIGMIPENDNVFSMADSLGTGISLFAKVFKKIQPDINVILGDRDEALASALAASHMNIPNAHIHGGDKTQGGIDEYNRHAITKISNIHFAATKKSMKRIIKMGENPKYVFLVGSPSVDEILQNKITGKKKLELKYNLKFSGNEIVLLQHPVTTQTSLSEIFIKSILEAIVRIKHTTIVITPNSDPGNKVIFDYLEKFSKKYPFIQKYTTLSRADYLGMLKNCGVLVGNSSSGMIEGSYFNIPIINIGIRQNARERGTNVFDVLQVNEKNIYTAITKALKIKNNKKFHNQFVYGKSIASKKIVKYLENIKINEELIQKQIFY